MQLRTATKDVNYFSLNVDSIVWFAGSSEERQTSNIPYPLDLLPDDSKRWDSILKLSGRVDTALCGLRVSQGKENSLDINNETHHCSLEGQFGITGNEGEQVITIKGGSYGLSIKGSIDSKGTNCDIEIGQWSDQSTKTTHHIDLSLLRSSRPLSVVFGRVNNPILAILGKSPDIALPPNARILVWKSLGLLGYWWVKRIYVLIRYHRW